MLIGLLLLGALVLSAAPPANAPIDLFDPFHTAPSFGRELYEQDHQRHPLPPDCDPANLGGAAVTPEPATFGLAGLALAGLWFGSKRRYRGGLKPTS